MSISEGDPEPLQSFRPYDGSLLWEGVTAGPEAVTAAVERAHGVRHHWAMTPLDERIAIVRRYRDLVQEETEAFARLIAEETGKPLWEARTEVASVAAKVEISITAHAERTGARSGPLKVDPAGAMQAVRHKPHGVLAVLGPYNFPAHLPNGHIVPALIAGNVVVFKPSEHTPATGAFMAGLWHKAGLPEKVLQVVQGGRSTGEALAAADIDGLLFTGSAAGGESLALQMAATPSRILALEMGGNNPLVVWDLADSDIEAAARIIVQSAFLSAGQRCTCARRLIVQSGREGPLLEAVVALTDRLRIDQPFADPQPFMGTLIDNRAADYVLAGAARMGGRVIRELARTQPGLPFLKPGIIDVTGQQIMDEEVFGPLLQVWRAPDFMVAIAAANNTRFGLSAALLGGDRALYDRFWAASRAGVVNWNRPTNGASSSAPFGGIGRSGNHRPSAYYAADYCAWPVASVEAATPFLNMPTGVGDA